MHGVCVGGRGGVKGHARWVRGLGVSNGCTGRMQSCGRWGPAVAARGLGGGGGGGCGGWGAEPRGAAARAALQGSRGKRPVPEIGGRGEVQPQEGGGGGRGCGSFLSLRHSVALSMQAEGGRAGGGEGAGREDGGRREGMLAGPPRRDVPAAGGAPPAAPQAAGQVCRS